MIKTFIFNKIILYFNLACYHNNKPKFCMLPIEPLMTEHRLIERMVSVMNKKLKEFEKTKKADVTFVSTAIDFIKTYADVCHHGKEENILFIELFKKNISAEHKKILEELKKEHVEGRKITKELAEANNKYANGDKNAFDKIKENMSKLIQFYPMHIDKEDNHFFLEVMDYFTQKEKDQMLERCFKYDQTLIHHKYKEIVYDLEHHI